MSRQFRLVILVAALILPALAVAQVVLRGGGGGGVMVMAGGGNAVQYRQQMLDAIKDQLGLADDDWDKISPKIEKVMDAKHNAATGAGISWSSQNGAAPVFKVSNANVDTPAGKAMQDVRAALDDKDTPP